MNTTTILCPKCRTEIPLTDAVTQRIRQELDAEYAACRLQLEKQIGERETKLGAERRQLEQRSRQFDDEVATKLATERQKLMADARAHAQQTVGVEMQDLQTRLRDRDEKLRQAQETELSFRKRQRELEDRSQSLELEVTRKLDAERAKLAESLRAQAAEDQRLRLAEKEKLIGDLQHQISVLKQKAEQGSMQLQGEVLELDLEGRLAVEFPLDRIEPVAKGQRGADVLQRVCTSAGHECGNILWETKRARNWSRDWPAKLKEDQRAAKAGVAVLVSEVLPAEVHGFGWFEGVWVCNALCALPLAGALRQGIVTAAMARQNEEGRHGKMEQVFAYLTSLEFRQRVEGVVEAFVAMRDDLEAEKRSLQKHWGRREKQLEQAIMHTALLYGGVQGIVGSAALPEIQVLQLEQPAPCRGEDETPSQP